MNALQARFIVWLLATLMLAGFFFGQVLPNLKIETDITAMLPQLGDGSAQDAELQQALQEVADRGSRRTLFLVGAPQFTSALKAAETLAASLRASAAFSDVVLEINSEPGALDAAYGPARRLLLSDRHRALLAAGQSAQLGEDALRALYTPSGLMRVRPFAEDPLNLYGDFLAAQIPVLGHLQPREGVLSVNQDGLDYVLVSAELAGNPFAIAIQRQASPVLEHARAQAEASASGVRVLCAGVIQHAIANGERASGEVAAFGSVSMLGVVGALLLTFRSARPLFLSLLSLAIGSMAAISICYLLFERIHLLALVFGTSLVGVGVDYSLHFFADQFRQTSAADAPWSGAQALTHVGPAISVGVLTAALGYLSFLVPPFPGLRQIAALSVTGIFAAALCVLMAYPLLAGRGRAAPATVLRAMQRLAALRQPARLRLIAVLLLAFTAAGLWRLQFVDDVRSLQSSPAALMQQEQAARALMGGGHDSRFFLVTGADSEAVLQTEEALRIHLEELRTAGGLGSYTALSRAVPSRLRQSQNEAWLQQQVYAEGGALPQLFSGIGYPAEAADHLRAEFQGQRGTALGLEDWLVADAARALRPLWLGVTASGAASVLVLSGVHDLAALKALEGRVPGVRLVDRVADISATMTRFRQLSLWGLALALCAIGVLLCARYGWRNARRHLLAPLGACLLTLATLGLLGIPANLFSVLALLLVLGLGVDYTVFLHEGAASRPTTLLAISLAGLTTLLAFGMLAASATPFIASLGLSVLLGVAYTWLLAVLASAPVNRDNS